MSLNEQELLVRVAKLEERVSQLEAEQQTINSGDFIFEEVPAAAAPSTPPWQRRTRPREPFPVTQVLGWGGMIALVMAAAYLIKLGIDLGWLTPTRQIMLAFLSGACLIVAGLLLRRADRQYASLLPAGGIVILFLTNYGAHLYYRLLTFPAAVGGLVLICLLSLWLCRHFTSEIYVFFAITGSYTAPLLLDGLRAEVSDLAIYYTAWSLLFCAFSLWLKQRRIYLVAAYLALLGFDLIWYQQWHNTAHPQWQAALLFQFVQFALFSIGTALFTLQHRAPLDRQTALGHLPPLLLFYALEYSLMERYLPQWAPWIALGSLLVVLSIYLVARSAFRHSLVGGHLLLSAYAAIVLFHAGYLELLPDSLAPWAGLAVGLLLATWFVRQGKVKTANWPLAGALALVFIINGLRALLHFDVDEVFLGDYLALVYAIELYAAYLLINRPGAPGMFRATLLYAGHLAAMAAPVHIFNDRLPASFCWAMLAVVTLVLALKLRDKLLAQSSLFVFAVSGAKVLLYDLDQAAPLIRIACLVVLGISLYVGGWLYRKVGEMDGGDI